MDLKILSARIRDAIRLTETSCLPKFVGFLTSEELSVAICEAEKQRCSYEFFGGYEMAERVYFGIYPDWCEDKTEFFPIASLTFNFKEEYKLSHRDFLGALMSLGITRESIGDILVGEGKAVVFLSKEILAFVTDNIEKIGNVGVQIKEGFSEPLPSVRQMQEISRTIASTRLDCAVSALLNTSRSAAAAVITDGLVYVNSVLVDKTVKLISSGDKITVRGKGKFIIVAAEDRTKKDRIILKAKKYV